MPDFKSLTHGTLSNPYREVQAGQVVSLTDKEAQLYEKSRWLRPKAEVDGAKPQPLMPHMRVVGGESVSGLEVKIPDYAKPDAKIAAEQAQVGTQNFNKQMDALKASEARQDAASAKNRGKGTGNYDPLA